MKITLTKIDGLWYAEYFNCWAWSYDSVNALYQLQINWWLGLRSKEELDFINEEAERLSEYFNQS